MTTISYVRKCNPQSMVTYAADLAAQNDTFTGRVGQMNRDVDTAMHTWKGEAATAASACGLSQELVGNHLSETVVTIADTFITYGGELDGYRTSLLNIVDNCLPFAGMTVDDEGNVTASRPPAHAGTPLAVALLQQALDGQAACFQTRIKTLLAQFGDAEAAAAQAITTDLRFLTGYERTPDGVPLRSRVRDIVDGRAQLPTDPRQLHDFWQTLTPAEKDALWQHDQYLGNHDGLPAVDRDHYNRMKLQDELARARAGDPAVKDKLDDLRTIAASVDRPDRYLLQLDTQSGRIPHVAIASGNPDTSSNVATYVPGTGSRPAKMGDDMKRVDAMKAEALNAGAARPSVIAWLGYDAPQDIVTGATQRDYADAGAPALDRFQDGLRASHEGAPSYNSVVGHSYGTVLVGDAAGHGRSLDADAAVMVASPGTTVDHAGDLSLTGVPHDEVAKHIFATEADHDPVPEYARERGGQLEHRIEHWAISNTVNQCLPFGPGNVVADVVGSTAGHAIDDFGPDPAGRSFGARVFDSDPGKSGPYAGFSAQAHSQYWDQNSSSLRGMGDIIAGHGDAVVNTT
ncbi:alpha/beta hydrolase [Nocardia sp. NPDC051570]|uniref:alpha/beta hydrolase n=1 Tax=Nocardia sp. NPDC051570 TaxID=3364324 RepID=UPI0037B9B0E7